MGSLWAALISCYIFVKIAKDRSGFGIRLRDREAVCDEIFPLWHSIMAVDQEGMA